jgi:hypothetical protein
MGVVAALVLTVAAAGFALGPTEFREANLYNDQVSLALTIFLAASYGFSLYTINGTFEIITMALKIQEERFLDWLRFWRGRPNYEYWGTMCWSLWTLTASMLAIIYLLKGGVHFWAAAGVIWGMMCVNGMSSAVLNENFLQHHLFLDGEGAGGAGVDGATSDAHATAVVTQAKPTQRAAATLPDVAS